MNRRKNVCQKVYERQLQGRKLYLKSELNLIQASCFEKEKKYIDETLKTTCLEFIQLYQQQKRSYYEIKLALRSILKQLSQHENKDEACQRISELGIVEMMFELLVTDVFKLGSQLDEKKDSTVMVKCPHQNIDEAYMILDICGMCCECSLASYHHLRWNYKLIEALFSLLLNSSKVCTATVMVLEYILLGINQPPVDLANIRGFKNCLANLKFDVSECPFFHLLSMFMSDSEFIASSNSILQRHDHWLPSRSARTVESNQRFLLDVPEFLEKMCLATCDGFPQQQAGSDSSQLNELISVLNLIPYAIPTIQEFAEDGGQWDPFINIRFHSMKMFVADVFHITSLLLLGKHRGEVQRRLADCGFFSSLRIPANQIVFRMQSSYSYELEISNDPSSDEVSMDMYVQIQFLRLVHAIAENHENRYYLLSSTELQQLIQLAEEKHYKIPEELSRFDPSKLDPDEKGLLTIVVDKLKMEGGKSLIRFWINRAMESFLRGQTCTVHQSFLLAMNVIEDTVRVLLSFGPKHDMVVQGSFDFLSTVMRNNAEAFLRLEVAIECTANFTQLVRSMDENLVDSNMFVRCVILTNHFLRGSTGVESEKASKSRLLNWYVDPEVLLKIACRLIRLLNLSSLSQENVSCLNTTILLLYLADKEKKLPRYLSALSAQPDGQFLLNNFKSLLQFWRTHYSLPSKSSDRSNLEMSTGVFFDQWFAFVDLILSPDATSSSSIRHYISDKKTLSPSISLPTRDP